MPKTRSLTIIAQDPSVLEGKAIIRQQVVVPYEDLGSGPRGYRAHVVDYDASQQVLYRAAELGAGTEDRFLHATDAELLSDPAFHAQNVYAIVMRTLSRFELALGRRVGWSFGGHQLHIAPHAFCDANAYYSEDDRGLFLGYFAGQGGKRIYTCLSHDVIAHETTHALLDGLRDCYTFPSGPDQAGFHEGFADVVALLSVFGAKNIVMKLLPACREDSTRVPKAKLTVPALRESALAGLAEQFGQETSQGRVSALRRSAKLPPDDAALDSGEYNEPHKRGEILSAAMMNAFLMVWRKRLESWLPTQDANVSRERVAEDGVEAADHLLTMAIRALDYCPVVDVTFADFLSALLTADYELLPDDGKYQYRSALRDQFAAWRILPASPAKEPEQGAWEKPDDIAGLQYGCVHLESLVRDQDEVFRFLWENRKCLGIYDEAYTLVQSVRPCTRTGPDGFVLRETVAEYRQNLEMTAGQLGALKIEKPAAMPDSTPVRLRGGGALIFDDFGHLKYHVHSRIGNARRQSARLKYLWRNGLKDEHGGYGFSDGVPAGRRFAVMHLRRAGRLGREEWHD